MGVQLDYSHCVPSYLSDLQNFFESDLGIMSDRNIQFKASMVGMWLDMEIPVVLEQISNLLQLKNFQKVKVQLSRQGLKLTRKGKLPGLSSEDLIPLQNIEDIFVDDSIPTCFICITTACSSSPTQIMAMKCLTAMCAQGIVKHYKALTGNKKRLVESLRNAQLASLGASQTSNNSMNSDSSEGNNNLSDSVGSNTESGYTTDHNTTLPSGRQKIFPTVEEDSKLLTSSTKRYCSQASKEMQQCEEELTECYAESTQL